MKGIFAIKGVKLMLVAVLCALAGSGVTLLAQQALIYRPSEDQTSKTTPPIDPYELLSVLPMRQWEMAGRNCLHTGYTERSSRVKDGYVNLPVILSVGPVVCGDAIIVGGWSQADNRSYVYEINPIEPSIIAVSEPLKGNLTDVIVVPIQAFGIARREIFAATTEGLYWLRESITPEGGELQVIRCLEGVGGYMTWANESLIITSGSTVWRVVPTVMGTFFVCWTCKDPVEAPEGGKTIADQLGPPAVYDGVIYVKDFVLVEFDRGFIANEYLVLIDLARGEVIKRIELTEKKRGPPPPPPGPLCGVVVSIDPVNEVAWLCANLNGSWLFAYDIPNDRIVKLALHEVPNAYYEAGIGELRHAPAVLTKDFGNIRKGTVFFVTTNYTGPDVYSYFCAARYDRDAGSIALLVRPCRTAERNTLFFAQPILLGEEETLWLYAAGIQLSADQEHFYPYLAKIDVTAWENNAWDLNGIPTFKRLDFTDYFGGAFWAWRGVEYPASSWCAMDRVGFVVPCVEDLGYNSVLWIDSCEGYQ